MSTYRFSTDATPTAGTYLLIAAPGTSYFVIAELLSVTS